MPGDIKPPLHHCRIVLVQPTIPGNIGATARVMRNMGLADLVLVAPEASPADRQARQMATQGEDILDTARVVEELGQAVADCVLVLGTSARHGGLIRRQSVVSPEQAMPALVRELRAGNPAAIVFGTEAHGLTDAEVTRCHYLLHIPTDLDYPVLNLAQAVAICLYELRRAWDKGAHHAERDDYTASAASFDAQEYMFGKLQTALEEIHFLYGPKAESLMHALRHLLGRARLTAMEVNVLWGLARQIRWHVEQARVEQDNIAPRENPP